MTDLGFRNGDKIITINSDTVHDFDDIQAKLFIGGKKVVLERDGNKEEIDLPVELIGKLIKRKNKKRMLMTQRLPSHYR